MSYNSSIRVGPFAISLQTVRVDFIRHCYSGNFRVQARREHYNLVHLKRILDNRRGAFGVSLASSES